jgi:ABC-type hemin transport system substrate-binding protein
MPKRLTTAGEVIAELGGFAAVNALTKRKAISASSMWKMRGKFPPNTFSVMQAALEAAGASAPGSLWGMPETETERLPEDAAS